MATGLNQTLEYDLLGTGSGPWTRFDRAKGDNLDPEGGGAEHDDGVTGQDEVYRGMVVPAGAASTTLTEGALLPYIVPAAIGSLPPVIGGIQGGVLNDADAARLQTTCYLRTLELSCVDKALMSANYSWYALRQTGVLIASAATEKTQRGFPWHAGTVEIDFGGGAAAYRCPTWTISVATGVYAETTQDEKVAGVQRAPEWFEPGDWTLALTATLRTPSGVNFTADDIDVITFLATCTNADGDVLTADLTGGPGLHLMTDPLPIVVGGTTVGYEISAESEHNDFAMWDVSIA